MPGIGTTIGSQTGARSQTAGAAGIVLFSVAVGVMALFTLLVAVSDARSRAERQAETQAAANAAAVGAVADLPKGTAAVLRSAGRILGSQKAEGLPGRFGAQAIQVGHWDAAGQSFVSGAGEPRAVRITVRLSNERTFCALFLGSRTESPIESSAVAVLDTTGHPVVAEARATDTAAR
jgi:Putative Tad-like Flp pilus-assembly